MLIVAVLDSHITQTRGCCGWFHWWIDDSNGFVASSSPKRNPFEVMFFAERYCTASACTKHERGAVTHSLAGLEDIQCETSSAWHPGSCEVHWKNIGGHSDRVHISLDPWLKCLEIRFPLGHPFCWGLWQSSDSAWFFLGGLLVKHCETANAAAITRLEWIINPFLFVPPLLLSWKHSIHLRKNSSSPTQDSTKISHEGPMLHGSRDVSCTPVWI